MSPSPLRPGEAILDFAPGDDVFAGVTAIGTIHSPWSRGNCPRSIARARESGQGAQITLKPGYVPGLTGLSVGQPVILLYWMHDARRDLILQTPRHADGPRGTFALRSPNRPNTIALCTVVITNLDLDTGVIGIDAIDVFDGTPLLDIKPWIPTIDTPPGGGS